MFLSAWILNRPKTSVELHRDFVSKKISHKSDFDLGVRIDMIKCNPERISVTDIRTLPTAEKHSATGGRLPIMIINDNTGGELTALVLRLL